MDASSREAIKAALQAFAMVHKIGKTDGDTIKWLECCQDMWLLVFDNADTPSLNIHEFFPTCSHGSILITTRLSDMTWLGQGPGHDCNLSGMDEQDALALLWKMAHKHDIPSQGDEMEAATALLKVHIGAATMLWCD